MRRTLPRLAALAGVLTATVALAQQPPQNLLPQPRLHTAFPAGVKAGTAVEVVVAGNDVGDATGLWFSHPGITAVVVEEPEPKADPKAKTPPPKMDKGKKKVGPVTSARFKVTVPADVLPGGYDVRVVSPDGVSNPRVFSVGTLPEVAEKEPNDDVPQAQKVDLGTVVNGVFGSPTDVDFVTFAGKAGQRFLAHCAASSIDSRARPLLELYTADGRRLALNRNYADADALLDVTLPSDGDYLLRLSEFAYQYGGPDYFYRLTVGLPFHIDAVFPPAVQPGKPTAVTVYGRNLPGGKPAPGVAIDGRPLDAVTTTVTPPADTAARTRLTVAARVGPGMALADGFELRLSGPAGPSAPVPVFLTDLPVTLESDKPNDTPEAAQEFAAPAEVAGRIEKRYDRDFYRFTAKKGETYAVSLLADRAGSEMDTYFQLRTPDNKPLGPEQDDNPDPLHPTTFFNRTGDPPTQLFTAPADGPVLVFVGSRESSVSYGPRCGYRLRVAKPAPDFRAVIAPRSRDLPSAAVVRADGETALDVFIDRQDGFDGPVAVTAANLPAGVTAKPTTVGSGAKWGTLVLSAAAGAKAFTGPYTVAATAEIDGKPATREARPVGIVWATPPGQNNVPAIARLEQKPVLAVREAKALYRVTADPAAAKLATKGKDGKPAEAAAKPPFFVKPGDKLTLPLKVVWHDKEARANPVTVTAEPFQANMQQAPITVANVTVAKDKADAPLVVDVKADAKPGTYAVALRAETQQPLARDLANPSAKTPLTVPAYAPDPLVLTVLPTSLAKLTATAPGGNDLKPGGSAALTVRVERQHNYAGPFQLTVEFPKGTAGLTAAPVALPAGATEVKVPLTAAADAKPGTVQNVVVTATATVHEKFPVTHEAKVNVTVAKPDKK